jgi:hypothetical protein
MAGLVPAIHVFEASKAWMPGIKPGMTVETILDEMAGGASFPPC